MKRSGARYGRAWQKTCGQWEHARANGSPPAPGFVANEQGVEADEPAAHTWGRATSKCSHALFAVGLRRLQGRA